VSHDGIIGCVDRNVIIVQELNVFDRLRDSSSRTPAKHLFPVPENALSRPRKQEILRTTLLSETEPPFQETERDGALSLLLNHSRPAELCTPAGSLQNFVHKCCIFHRLPLGLAA
jgi:hypothetical protein